MRRAVIRGGLPMLLRRTRVSGVDEATGSEWEKGGWTRYRVYREGLRRSLVLAVCQQVGHTEVIGTGWAGSNCGSIGRRLLHRMAVGGGRAGQLVLDTLRGTHERGCLGHEQSEQERRDSCGESARRSRLKTQGHSR